MYMAALSLPSQSLLQRLPVWYTTVTSMYQTTSFQTGQCQWWGEYFILSVKSIISGTYTGLLSRPSSRAANNGCANMARLQYTFSRHCLMAFLLQMWSCVSVFFFLLTHFILTRFQIRCPHHAICNYRMIINKTIRSIQSQCITVLKRK